MRPSSRFAGDAFRAKHAFRCDCLTNGPDWGAEQESIRAALAEIIRLRLCAAYVPLLQGLQRIEDRVSILTNLREDPYVPPKRRDVRVQAKV